MRLSLEDLFLNRSGGDESVNKAIFLLAVPPDTGQSLLVGCRIPIGIKKHKSICSDQVETASSGLAAEKKDEFVPVWVIEFIHQLLPLIYIHGTVQAQASILSVPAELFENIERLRVVADQHNLVIGVLSDSGQHAIEHLHLSRVPSLDLAIPSSRSFRNIVVWEKPLASWQVHRKIEKVWMIAKLLQQTDGNQRLTSLPAQKALDIRALDEVVV